MLEILKSHAPKLITGALVAGVYVAVNRGILTESQATMVLAVMVGGALFTPSKLTTKP